MARTLAVVRLGGAAGAAVLAAATAAAGTPAATTGRPVAKPCPPKAVVQTTLKQKIVKVSETSASYSDGQGVDGARRTCTYLTKAGVEITVVLSAGAQVLGFVDAEDAALDANTGYQSSRASTQKVVPVFGKANDAWALKSGGSLSALYKKDAIVISAPHTTVPELKALAQATLGIPSPSREGV